MEALRQTLADIEKEAKKAPVPHLRDMLEQMIKNYSRDLVDAEHLRHRTAIQVAKGKLAVVKALWTTYVEEA